MSSPASVTGEEPGYRTPANLEDVGLHSLEWTTDAFDRRTQLFHHHSPEGHRTFLPHC